MLLFSLWATTEIYTLSLHDALPIFPGSPVAVDRLVLVAAVADLGAQSVHDLRAVVADVGDVRPALAALLSRADRKSTRLNSSHANISYAVFCLKKKNLLSFHSPSLQ